MLATAVVASEFPELAAAEEVRTVPTVVVGQRRWHDVPPLVELLTALGSIAPQAS